MANQNECITDLRKDRKATRHQPSEKVQETQRRFSLIYVV